MTCTRSNVWFFAFAFLAIASAIVAPQQTARRFVVMANGKPVETFDISWIENLETYPENDCGQNIFFHLARIQPNRSDKEGDIDPCNLGAISLGEIVKRALEKLLAKGIAILEQQGDALVSVPLEQLMTRAGFEKLMRLPEFQTAVGEVLAELQKQWGRPGPINWIR